MIPIYRLYLNKTEKIPSKLKAKLFFECLIKSPAMNIVAHVFWNTCAHFSVENIPRSRISGSDGICIFNLMLIFNFKWYCQMVF